MNVTLPQRILKTLLDGDEPLTASQVARKLKAPAASVSTALLRLYKRGKIIRATKPGPRGGQTYTIPPQPRPSLWEAIRSASAQV
jgi:predicted transcriptional regulator